MTYVKRFHVIFETTHNGKKMDYSRESEGRDFRGALVAGERRAMTKDEVTAWADANLSRVPNGSYRIEHW